MSERQNMLDALDRLKSANAELVRQKEQHRKNWVELQQRVAKLEKDAARLDFFSDLLTELGGHLAQCYPEGGGITLLLLEPGSTDIRAAIDRERQQQLETELAGPEGLEW